MSDMFGCRHTQSRAFTVDSVASHSCSDNRRERSCIAVLTDESRPRGGFIPAETQVQNDTAGDNGTAGGTLTQPVLARVSGRMKPLWAAFHPIVRPQCGTPLTSMKAATTTAPMKACDAVPAPAKSSPPERQSFLAYSTSSQ